MKVHANAQSVPVAATITLPRRAEHFLLRRELDTFTRGRPVAAGLKTTLENA